MWSKKRIPPVVHVSEHRMGGRSTWILWVDGQALAADADEQRIRREAAAYRPWRQNADSASA